MKVGFIPARKGSKRLVNKNILPFCGNPLIAYSIAFAKFCKLDKIIVSTDDEQIADISMKLGAEILMRPKELASDYATTASAATHCIDSLFEKNFFVEVFVTLQPTNPLRYPSLFSDALNEFNTKLYDSVISVTLNEHKLGRVVKTKFQPLSYIPGTRSQDLDALHYENGLIYLTKSENVLNEDLFGNNIGTTISDKIYGGTDIDTLLDFQIAEQIYINHYDLFKFLEL